MKKIIFSTIALAFFFVPTFIQASCQGGTIYVCSAEDWNQAQDDFRDNCCAGSSATIENVCNNTSLPLYNETSGANSSCSPL